MNYEVKGRDDFEKNSLDSVDLQITGLISTHVRLSNLDGLQNVVYSLGAAPTFPASWRSLSVGEEKVLVKLGGETQINFRKKVFYRNVARNDDNSTRVNDVTATVSVEQVDP